MDVTKNDFTDAEWALFTASEQAMIMRGERLPQWGIGYNVFEFPDQSRRQFELGLTG